MKRKAWKYVGPPVVGYARKIKKIEKAINEPSTTSRVEYTGAGCSLRVFVDKFGVEYKLDGRWQEVEVESPEDPRREKR